MFLAAVLAATVNTPCDYRPELTLVPIASRATISHAGRLYRAGAHITFAVRTVRKARPSNDLGMRTHALGYYTIAQRLAQPSEAHAVGSSEAQARARLKKTIAELAHDVNTEYDRQQRVYDSVTENGRAQNQGPAFGFPGGPDATAYCAK